MNTTSRLSALLLMGCLAGCAHAPAEGQSFRDLQYPMATKYVDVGGIQLAYSDQGHGPKTLVMIHGLGSYSPVWSRNLAALSEHARVVTFDLPGYGRSSKANYRYSMDFFADVTDALIQALHLKHVVLVGHSMGGQIALTYALRHPGKAEALVLAAPAGFETFNRGEGEWLESVLTTEAIKAESPEAIYRSYAQNFYDMPEAARFMVKDRLAISGGPDIDGYAYAVVRSVAAMIDGPVYDQLPEIQLPTLVVFGRGDQLIPNPYLHGGRSRDVGMAGVSRMPHAKLVVVPHAGHMVMFEQPKAFDDAVLGFLAQLSAPTEARR